MLQRVLAASLYTEGMDAYLSKRFGISRKEPDQAWNQLCRNFIPIGKEQYGETWVYEQEMMDHKRFFVNVRKCGLNDFLLANDARDLLFSLCVLDYAWADILEEYGIAFERPTLLSEGSDACRFQFFKK